MLHFLYVGHFAHEGNFIKFEKLADGSLQPALERPLSMDIIQNALEKRGQSASTIPDEWGVWLDDGYIVCDAVTHNRDAIELIRDVAQQTGCDLADYSSRLLWTPAEWARGSQVAPANGKMQDHQIDPHSATLARLGRISARVAPL